MIDGKYASALKEIRRSRANNMLCFLLFGVFMSVIMAGSQGAYFLGKQPSLALDTPHYVMLGFYVLCIAFIMLVLWVWLPAPGRFAWLVQHVAPQSASFVIAYEYDSEGPGSFWAYRPEKVAGMKRPREISLIYVPKTLKEQLTKLPEMQLRLKLYATPQMKGFAVLEAPEGFMLGQILNKSFF